MEEQKFELQLHFSESGIVCNAQALKEMLPEKLRPYQYIVTENNYSDAKVDRAKLNNLRNVLKEARDKFESTDLADWQSFKTTIMDMEKMIAKVADGLGSGINDIDEKEKLAKMEEIKKSYAIVSQSMPLEIPFEKLYIRKTYDAKKWTVKKIQEDLQVKINKIIQEWEMLKAYMPSDPADVEQVKLEYINTLDVGLAKSKADDLKAIRAKVEQQNTETSDIPQTPCQQPVNEPKENLSTPVRKKQHIIADFVAERPFFDAMNQLIIQYKPQVEIIKKENL